MVGRVGGGGWGGWGGGLAVYDQGLAGGKLPADFCLAIVLIARYLEVSGAQGGGLEKRILR